MIEFINKMTESQTSEKVRKVLRSDPDKQSDKEPGEESKFEDKYEMEEPHDKVILSGGKRNALMQRRLQGFNTKEN